MKLQLFGDYFFEFMIITLLLSVSFVLVIPFIPVLVGIVGYLNRDIHTRRLKDIFINIKNNWKIIIGYTIFELVLLIASILNIYYFNTQVENMNSAILVLSYIALILAMIYLITGPIILLNMNVNLKQLIYNGFILFSCNIKNSLGTIVVLISLILATLYFPYVVVLVLYFVVKSCHYLMRESFYILKAKALGKTVLELKKEQQGSDDDYYEEIYNR